MDLSREELFWAYRLAKIEVAAEQRGIDRASFAAFEQNLANNLRSISAKGLSLPELLRSVAPGKIWVRPKSIKTIEIRENSATIRVPNQPSDHPVSEMKIRIMLEPTPEFALCEVLWIREFGPALELALTPNCMSNRLDLRGSPGAVAEGGRRLYSYWARSYSRFRSEGLAVASEMLRHNDSRCLLSVFDMSAYYDRIDPSFLLSDEFVDDIQRKSERLRVDFDLPRYLDATSGLIRAFARYRELVSDTLGSTAAGTGIPIGSLSARMISNLALATLDKYVLSRPTVRYYARYVDDLLIVEEIGKDAVSPLSQTMARLLPLHEREMDGEQISVNEKRLGRSGSRFIIQQEKIRLFDLRGEPGRSYLKVIEDELERLSSERRKFLETSGVTREESITTSLDGEPIRALRKADALRLKKYEIGIICQKVTTAATMLDRSEAAKFSRDRLAWASWLATDWGRWIEHIDTTMRILEASLVAGDAQTCHEVIAAVQERLADFQAGDRSFKVTWCETEIDFKRAQGLLAKWFEARLREVICSSIPFDSSKQLIEGLEALNTALLWDGSPVSESRIALEATMLSAADLRYLDRESDLATGTTPGSLPISALRGLNRHISSKVAGRTRVRMIRKLLKVAELQGDKCYRGLNPVSILLMVRPPSYVDIVFRWLASSEPLGELLEIINAVRGNRYKKLPGEFKGRELVVGASGPESGPTDLFLILGNLCTDADWWERSLGQPVLSMERQERLARVLNQAIEVAIRGLHKVTPALLVLPELSIPRKWMREVLRHVETHAPNLSLVAGLEYLVDKKKVKNQVVAFIPCGYHSCAGWIWTKGNPADLEGAQLKNNKFDFDGNSNREAFVAISCPSGRYAPLICSEVLEVEARSQLSGRLEVLLVPAWNTDTTTFEHLVHSTALELHCFVAIANNGEYSDCRVAAPYKEPKWKREVCRLIARGRNEIICEKLETVSLRASRLGHSDLHEKAPPKRGSQWKPIPPGYRKVRQR